MVTARYRIRTILASWPFVWASIDLGEPNHGWDRDYLPDEPGLYCVMTWSNEIIYVGQTRSLYRRWQSHHRLKQVLKFSDTRIFYCTHQSAEPELQTLEQWLIEEEANLIAELRPPLNNAMLVEPRTTLVISPRVVDMVC